MSDDYILAIDTSLSYTSLVLVNELEEIIFSEQIPQNKNTNSLIFTYLEKVLEITKNKLSKMIIGIGPGSYSGIRVGITALHGIKLSLGCDLIAVPSYYGLENIFQTKQSFYVIGDARRNKIHITKISYLKDGIPTISKKIEKQSFFAQNKNVNIFVTKNLNAILIDSDFVENINSYEEEFYTIDKHLVLNNIKLIEIHPINFIKYYKLLSPEHKAKLLKNSEQIEPIYIFPPTNTKVSNSH